VSLLLIVFVRLSAKAHWLVQTTVNLTARPNLGPTRAVRNPAPTGRSKKLKSTPAAAIQDVLAGSNSDLHAGSASPLIPDPLWYSDEATWLQPIGSEAGAFTSQTKLGDYPTCAIRESSGSALVVFTFSMSNSETEGQGYWLNTALFPRQLVVTQNGRWLWTVAVTVPLRTNKRGLSIAGVAFGPTAAIAETTLGQTLTFGP